MAQQTALVSVSDKSGLTDLVKALAARGVRIVSTGGTAAHLRAAGVAVMEVSELTKFPEILDGRVKTLHPAVHSGLLARRDEPAHMETLDKLGLGTIDYVIVNLYPFVKTAADATKSAEDVIEQIDIGGPSMLRSAAKNFHSVTVVCDPADYARVAEEINRDGQTSESLRADLAAKVFTLTSSYDTAIANFLHSKVAATSEKLEGWPAVHGSSLPLAQPMRYGENPHQAAAFYRDPSCGETSLASSRQLHGKELSYNNILDAEGALEMVRDFADLAPSAAVIVKHSNPCGIALGDTPLEAYHRARETDPDSAFGGIVAFSSPVDKDTAEAISASFNEIVIAPDFTAEGLEVLRKKKNLRVLATGPFTPKLNTRIMRGIVGGAVVTDRDLGMITVDDLKFVSMKQPEPGDREALLFAWRCVKWVKSNAIVYTEKNATLGIGAGQMSRIDSANLAAMKSHKPLAGSYMASDAFFPFRDCVDIAAKHKVHAIIQPGGSIRDDDSVTAADEHGIIMAFTGMRHFRH